MKKLSAFLFSICIVVTGIITANAQDPVAEGAEPEVVTDGYQFTEGPYWHPDGYLLFSDIPANTIYKWEPGAETEVFVKPSGNSNGIAADSDGTIYLAQHAGKISTVSEEGKTKTVVSQYQGKRLNSPNDLVIHSDGTIYFTDPPFGVSKEERELEFSGVYKLSGDGTLTPFFKEFSRPNGIALSPDETKLYVNDSQTGQIKVFDIDENGNPVNPRDFAGVGEMSDTGAADGMKVDREGRVYSTGPGGVYVFNSEGEQVKKISMEVRITNLGWGGSKGTDLYMTAPNAVYRLEMNVQGVR